MRTTIMEATPEGNQTVLLARVVDDDNTPLLRAEISSITAKSYDTGDPANALVEESLTVNSVIYDTLQTDSRWDVDTTGYNFAYKVPNTYFPQGNRTYQVELKFTETGGDYFFHIWQIKTENLFQR